MATLPPAPMTATLLALRVRITFANGKTLEVSPQDARAYLGIDRLHIFPDESEKAHACAVKHALSELAETGCVTSWSLDPTGTESFTITLA